MTITKNSKCLNCGSILGFHGLLLLELKAKQSNMNIKDMVPMCAPCISISNQFKSNFSESAL